MSAKLTFNQVATQLKQQKSNLRCKDVADFLKLLGFEVRDGRRGGHKIYVHDALPDFMSGSYNCGHGKNPEIKAAYIIKIIRVLEEHQKAIEDYLESTK